MVAAAAKAVRTSTLGEATACMCILGIHMEDGQPDRFIVVFESLVFAIRGGCLRSARRNGP